MYGLVRHTIVDIIYHYRKSHSQTILYSSSFQTFRERGPLHVIPIELNIEFF